MAQLSPQKSSVDLSALVECIRACFDCSQACTACADDCLGEQQIQMLIRCIRLDLDCADICATTGNVLSRQTAFEPTLSRALLQACAQACKLCGDECEQHAQHGMEHCRVCTEACRRCEQACNTLLSKLAPMHAAVRHRYVDLG